MSANRDPFELLPHFVDPEPDPVVMKATIAQSRDAFSRRSHPVAGGQSRAVSDWVRNSLSWLIPAGAGALALVAAIVVTPSLMDTGNRQNDQMVADSADAMPPTLSRGDNISDTPTPGTGGVRMGMQPPPGVASQDLVPQAETIFSGDNIRITVRPTPSALELYLPDIAGAPLIDSQGVLPGESVEVLAAFQMSEPSLVAVRLRVDDSFFWRIYRQTEGAFTRDTALSALVSDAADRAEVEQRILSQ